MSGDGLDLALRALAEETARVAPPPRSTAWLRLAAGRRAERRRAARLARVQAAAVLLPSLALAAGLGERWPGSIGAVILLAVPAAVGLGLFLGARRWSAPWADDLSWLARPPR